VARFLNFYPRYDLDDLALMPVEKFVYLVGGMYDVLSPELTESREEQINRALRERAKEKMKKTRSSW
jgi:hypothetical protein